MSIIKSKEEIIQHKKNAIRQLNRLLERYICSDDPELLKKTDLISYWLETYSNYISEEVTFDSNRLIRYNRGNVIRVNFGFNIGKELGGLHYAIVLDNDNKRNADVITVVPLSSTEGRTVHPRSVDLGTEIFEKISVVQNKIIDETNKELEEIQAARDIIASTIELLDNTPKEQMTPENEADLIEKTSVALQYKSDLDDRLNHLFKNLDILERNNREIQKMKLGSMAVTNQITTVSKQRIYVPKRSTDFLYGISLSASAMDKINNKLKELYFF